MTEELMIEDKAKVFSDKSIAVHITKKNGSWLNGMITEVNANFLMLQENKDGLMPVFFKEIKNIQTLTKKEGEDEDKHI